MQNHQALQQHPRRFAAASHQQPKAWQGQKIYVGQFSLLTEVSELLRAISQKWKRS